MSDLNDQQAFKASLEQLCEDFIREGAPSDTNAEIGSALREFILKRERLRRGVSLDSHECEAVDRETLDRLSKALDLGPDLAIHEGIFRRLAADPSLAIDYYRADKATLTAKQRKRATKPRPGRLGSLSRLIDEIVADDPRISTEKVLRALKTIDGIVVIDGEIRNLQDHDTMAKSNLYSRVSDARNRHSG